MRLSDAACRGFKPGPKPIKKSDGGGLYLFITPTGGKWWKMAYRFGGKQKTLSLGVYPAVGLALARTRRAEAKAILAEGRDPFGVTRNAIAKRTVAARAAKVEADKAAGVRLFRDVAREWFDHNRADWRLTHAAKVWARIEANLLPTLGDMAHSEIGAQDVKAALKPVEDRGAIYSAHRIRQMVEAIYAYAIVTHGDVAANPALYVGKALKRVPAINGFKYLRFEELPALFAKLRADKSGDDRTRLAVEFALHTVLRTGEIRFARWSEFKGDEWHIPAARGKSEIGMKKVRGVSHDHIVPLTSRAQEILGELRPLAKGSRFVFPGERERVMEQNAMLYWLYARGYKGKATTHGFRKTFSTHANESKRAMGFDSEWIEMQLGHVDRNSVRGFYNKAEYLEDRRRMMNWWGDELAKQEAKGLTLLREIEADTADLL